MHYCQSNKEFLEKYATLSLLRVFLYVAYQSGNMFCRTPEPEYAQKLQQELLALPPTDHRRTDELIAKIARKVALLDPNGIEIHMQKFLKESR